MHPEPLICATSNKQNKIKREFNLLSSLCRASPALYAGKEECISAREVY